MWVFRVCEIEEEWNLKKKKLKKTMVQYAFSCMQFSMKKTRGMKRYNKKAGFEKKK